VKLLGEPDGLRGVDREEAYPKPILVPANPALLESWPSLKPGSQIWTFVRAKKALSTAFAASSVGGVNARGVVGA
jgi:hypothetical protein